MKIPLTEKQQAILNIGCVITRNNYHHNVCPNRLVVGMCAQVHILYMSKLQRTHLLYGRILD